ncbi:hypothetical protein ACFZ8E_15345 [Methylobacterium sp. HMF5984]|uniref:hypothetical protein n=1 Tax=Methylobacterium sp. HMF5984 TaxID=3367370 RepID=UPI003853FCB1
MRFVKATMKIDIVEFALLLLCPIGLMLTTYTLDRASRSSMSKAARNERRKITATLLNSLSIALFGAAFVGGFFQSDFFVPIAITSTRTLSASVAIWLAAGFGVAAHIGARAALIGMED